MRRNSAEFAMRRRRAGARVGRLERPLDPQHGLGEGGELEPLVTQVLSQLLDETEPDRLCIG
jgi:hypothetical protein